jgi:hypothetical protein
VQTSGSAIFNSVTVSAPGTLDLRQNATFNGSLTVSGTLLANSNAITIRFGSGSLASFTTGATVTIAPTAGVTDLLATASPTQWQLQLAAGVAQTFTNVRVQDCDVAGTVNPVATPATSFDLGGNDLFPAMTPGWENLQ